MPITYSISEIDQVIVEVWVGEVGIDALVSYWRDYLQDERVLTIRKTLVDLRGARVDFSAHELMRAVTEVVVPALNGRDWITAMVVKRVDQFRAGAQYQVFAQFYSYDSIFSEIDAAMAWLRKQELRAP